MKAFIDIFTPEGPYIILVEIFFSKQSEKVKFNDSVKFLSNF